MARAGEPEPVGASRLWLLGDGAAKKKNRSLLKKNEEPEPKKKIAGSPALIVANNAYRNTFLLKYFLDV